MKLIWKYDVPSVPAVWTLAMPLGATVLSFGVQNGSPVFWALVTNSNPKVQRQMYVEYTGADMKGLNFNSKFIGTVQIQSIVLHLFDNGVIEDNKKLLR